MPRQLWVPTDEERRLVEHYVTLGYTQEQIASLLGKSVDSLDRHCRQELDTGALKVNAKIGGKLFQKAMGGDTAALIFWAKTRMGWSEKVKVENTHEGTLSIDGSRLPPSLAFLTDSRADEDKAG